MTNLKFTRKAVDDLSQIWKYTQKEWSGEQADRYYRMLIDNCRVISSNPQLGKNYSGVSKNLMGFVAGRHIIFYRRLSESETEITRILHERMDLKNRLKEKK